MTAEEAFDLALRSGVWLYEERGRLRYRAEQGALTEEVRHALARHKDAILGMLHQLQNEASCGGSTAPALEPCGLRAGVPLSHAQQRLWLIGRLLQGSSHYNVPGALRLRGRLDRAAFEGAVRDIMERHEVLRTRFDVCGDDVTQSVCDSFDLPFAFEDLSALESEVAEEAVASRLRADAETAFDLEHRLPLRVRLIKTSANEHVASFNLHHVATDGSSFPILVREFAALYASRSRGTPGTLPPLRIQYRDYACWSRKLLSGELLESLRSYWRGQLAGAPDVHCLPLDWPRPRRPDHTGEYFRERVPAELVRQVREHARRERLTLFMALESALAIVLCRSGDCDDVVIGTPVAGRAHPDLEGLIGLFINTLALRSRPQADLSIAEFLRRNGQMILDAYEHEQMPFDLLVEDLARARDSSHPPIVQIMLTLHSEQGEGAPIALEGLRLEPLSSRTPVSKFELSLSIVESDGELILTWAYQTAVLSAPTVRQLAANFVSALREIVRSPGSRLGELRWPSAAVPAEPPAATARGAALPGSDSIEARFETWARREPDAVALAGMMRAVCYGELEAQASSIAGLVCARNFGAGARIALRIDEPILRTATTLAVLKCGGVLIPLPACYDSSQIELMLRQSDAQLLLCDCEPDLQIALPVPALVLDEGALRRKSPPREERPARMVDAGIERAAFVLFQQQRDGRLNPVTLSHRNVLEIAEWKARHSDAPPQRQVHLDATPVSVCSPVQDLLSPLLTGGCSVIATAADVREPVRIAQLIERTSTMTLTAHAPLLGRLQPYWDRCASVRTVLTDAPAAASRIANVLSQRAPKCDVWLVHGLLGLSWPLTARKHATGEPYEGSWAGTLVGTGSALVLDAAGRVIPDGFAGELYLEDFTACTRAERLASPAAPIATDEIVRRMSDGEIRALPGRHGIPAGAARTEDPRALQARACSSGWVSESFVKLARAGDGACIAVYVRPVDGALDNLRGRLGEALQVRSAGAAEGRLARVVVPVREFPRTKQGAIDEAKLPEPLESAPGEPDEEERTLDIERRLSRLWETVLPKQAPAAEMNFFAAGGHSLLAIVLTKRVAEEFEVSVPIGDFMEQPTLRALARLVAGAMGESSSPESHARERITPLSAEERAEPLPTSFSQRHIWLAEQISGGGPSYNLPAALRLVGRLQVEAMRRALESLVERHAILRTVYVERSGEPFQQVLLGAALEVHLIDLGSEPAEARPAMLKRYAQAQAGRPFDLRRELMFRAQILRLSDLEHVLLVNVHHIAVDGWSMAILVRELSQLYSAYVRGEPNPLSEPAIQFADFTVWHSRKGLGEDLSFWLDILRDVPKVHRLPLDRRRPVLQRHRGAEASSFLDAPVRRGLESLAQRHATTLFVTLQAAFSVLLHRYSGETDIVIGTPVANRMLPQTESLIGCFANTVALRANVDGNASFSQLLESVSRTTLSAFARQGVPLERIVDALKPERSASHHALFQVMLVLQNNDRQQISLPDIEVTMLPSGGGTSKFDVTLNVRPVTSGLELYWEYDTDLFEAVTMERMARNFGVLLESIVREPDLSVRELDILHAEERRIVTQVWNDTAVPYPLDQCVHWLFEQQAGRSPERTALVHCARRVTYAELDSQSNRVAHFLLSHDVRPESLVGLCMDPSPEMVMGLLGILKAGAVYVPIDPELPEARVRRLLEDVDASVVLTDERNLGRLASGGQRRHLCALDAEDLRDFEATPLRVAMDSSYLVYVIHTSGSAGVPKGVMVPHRALTNVLSCLRAELQLQPDDVMIAATRLSFDISTLEIFGPLLAGGSVVIATRAQSYDGAAMKELIKRTYATIMQSTPAGWRLLLEGGWEPDPSVRMCCGGEALPVSLARRLTTPSTRLWNLYGPTETTVWSTAARIEDADEVSIGRPLGNTQLYVLDSGLRPVPIGVVGELYIGGAGVARGYLKQPDLTAARFVPSAFADDLAERLYRTGDLVRLHVDGRLEFIGRADHQIKHRGYRIEPGEIEAALRSHPRVGDCLVVARGAAEESQLVAYVRAPEGAGRPDAAELRAYLRARLADYMVPGAFVFISEWPLTPNGKVNRGALPEPQPVDVPVLACVPPRTAAEKAVCALLAQLIGVPQVGPEDDFFQLGGNSLVAVRFSHVIREELGIETPVRTVFENPRAADLALWIEAHADAARLAVQAERPFEVEEGLV